MIVSSLCEYFKIMTARHEVVPEGYSSIKINYAVSLTKDGEIDGIFNMGDIKPVNEQSKSKKPEIVYPVFELPFRSQKPGIGANIVEHRPLYIFGLDCQGGELCISEKAKKSHAAFKETTIEFFRDIPSDIAAAYCKFAEKWNPEEQTQNAYILQNIKDYAKSNYIFVLSGRPDITLHEDAAVKQKWEMYYRQLMEEQATDRAQCSVYGEELPIARLHDKIKGVYGGQSSGCTLVCVNNSAEESYGKSQSFNSGVSTLAMKEYTQVLNYLLSSRDHRTLLDNMTVVHFALTEDENLYLDYVRGIFDETGDDPRVKDIEDSVKASMTLVSQGKNATFETPYNDKVEYCIFGIVPNSSRISIRFFYRNTFGEIRKNAERYHEDFAIGRMENAPPIWRIKRELLPPKGNDKLAPDLGEGLFRAMIQGTPFPQKLLQTAVRRIKTDVQINDTRAGLVKACLNRNYYKNKEKLKMSLDIQNKTPAYLCGRLFAVLEKIQQDSTNGTLNKTIGDTYFSSACSTPAVVFPKLMVLSRNHQAKLTDGARIYYDKMCMGILSGLEGEFPKTLTLEEQGAFIIGYYHQKEDLYTKKENKSEEI